jgi:hypothetical protein
MAGSMPPVVDLPADKGTLQRPLPGFRTAQAPEFARRPARTLWIGPDHHLVHYPVSAGTLVNLVAFAPAGDYTIESWTATTTIREFLARVRGLGRAPHRPHPRGRNPRPVGVA